uniref:RRM domain-containing protein n=1 Tax=Chenopodium quinoa TaxID=63459 RepID=A0A803LYW2_CHEQI
MLYDLSMKTSELMFNIEAHCEKEYITVLVCNGKNQNQARDDLHAFLGRRTEEFVSWLWKFLLKNETQLTASVSSDMTVGTVHSLCDVDRDKACANRTFKSCQSYSANMMGKHDKNHSSGQARKSSDIKTQKDYHSPLAKELANSAIQLSDLRNKVAKFDYSKKMLSSVRNYQPETVNDCEKHSRCTDLSPKAASLARKDVALNLDFLPASVPKSTRSCNLPDKEPASLLGRHPSSFQERSPAFRTQFSNVSKLSECPQMRNVGNALKGSLPPVIPSCNINQPRKCVWERLGKPQQDALSRSQTVDFCARDKAHCNKNWTDHHSSMIPNPSEQIVQASPLPALPRVQGSRKLRQAHQSVRGGGTRQLDDTMRPKNVVKTNSEVPSISNIGRKRQFGEISSQIDAGMTTEKITENQFEKAWQSSNISQVPSDGSQSVVPCFLPYSTNMPMHPMQQVDDMKLRLRQIELDMVKLRAKQISLEKDRKTNLLTKSGVIKPTVDGSRTVLVTNVHFEATKEALLMYFWKCGAVVDVKFADNMPSAREKSAYITFQNKVAADKALRFSRASFYSRTIKVCRTGEFPSTATASSAEISGKKMQITPSKSDVNSEGLSYSESHSKWQNEPSSSAHSEPLSSTFDETKTAAESTC